MRPAQALELQAGCTAADGASSRKTEQRESGRDCGSLHDPLPFWGFCGV